MHADSVPTTHAGVDHVRSLCSCCLDCLENVHSSFNFDPLNFSHTSDEHTTARHAVTGKLGKMNAYTLESCANVKDYMQNLTPSCKSTTSIYIIIYCLITKLILNQQNANSITICAA